MALFNYATRELSAKIVYYGPGLSGKTTNIEMVHQILRPEQKGRLISLPTETDRTLFFDFLPLELGEIKGFKVRFHLYTVPGQVFYNATRRLVLQGVDGVVFVADSQAGMMSSNAESLKNLEDNLATYGKKLTDLPFVMQYNKRDLKNVESVREIDRFLNPRNVPVFEGIAKDGVGVTETLVAISRMVFNGLRRTLLMPGETAESDELGDLADTTIGEKFRHQEEEGKDAGAEPSELLEELSDFEEIGPAPETEDEVELELGEPVPAEHADGEEPARPARAAAVEEEPLGEVGIDLPGQGSLPATESGPWAETTAEAQPGATEPAAAGGAGADAFEEIDVDLPGEATAPPAEGEGEPGASAEAQPEAGGAGADAFEVAEGPAAAGGAADEEAFEEVDVGLPEKPASPGAEPVPGLEVSVEPEEGGLTFLRFEGVFVSPEGHAVLPAVFLTSSGRPVRVRIRLSLERDRE